MNARPIAGLALRQFYLIRGSPVRLFPMFAWVAIDIVLWGFITRYLNSVSASGVDFVPTLLGAVLMWDFFTRIMQGVTTAFLEDVWSRNFLNLFATPLSNAEYMTGLVITSIATSLVGLVVMLVIATAVFGLPFFKLGLLLVPFLLVLFFSASRSASARARWCCVSAPRPNGSCGRCRRCCRRSSACSIRFRRCRHGCKRSATRCRLRTSSKACAA